MINMYVVLNTHHDEWVTLTPATQATVTDKITKVWAQIAGRFKDYGDYLIFETLNEPRLYGTQYEWTGGTHEARTVLNAYNLAIVNTVRSSGGNNALRHIMIPTHGAIAVDSAQDDLVIPNNDSRIIVSQHVYWPYNFTMNTGAGATSVWGSATDKSDLDKALDEIQSNLLIKESLLLSVNGELLTDQIHCQELYMQNIMPKLPDQGEFVQFGGIMVLKEQVVSH